MTGRRPGRIRIVAGEKRGLRIAVPTGAEVRPTSDMVREAVFDVLGPVSGLAVLDLFAGTGALGLEAMSRGAQRCVFVESDPKVAAVLRGNIKALEYDSSCRVIVGDYAKVIKGPMASEAGFDLLFVDPPYRMLAEVEATLAPILSRLLSPGGGVVIEGPCSSSAMFGRTPFFDRVYGDTRITMVRLEG